MGSEICYRLAQGPLATGFHLHVEPAGPKQPRVHQIRHRRHVVVPGAGRVIQEPVGPVVRLNEGRRASQELRGPGTGLIYPL